MSIMSSCHVCLSSTTAWDSGVHQVSWSHCPIEAPGRLWSKRNRRTWSAWFHMGRLTLPVILPLGRWKNLSINPLRILWRTFQGGAPANLLSFTEALIASFASLWQVSNVEDLSHPANLENGRRWRVSCYLCKNALTFVPDDVEWKMCIISNPW